MRYLWIGILFILIVSSISCASFKYDQYDKGYVLGKKPDFSIRIKGKGDVKVKRLPDGTIETDVKAGKPFMELGNFAPKYERE